MTEKSQGDFLDPSQITTYQLGVVQSVSFRLLKKHINHCLAERGLTTMQWFIVGMLYDAGQQGMRITDLAQHVDTTLGYLTNTINLLESKGMVIRTGDARDSRAKLVSINPSYRPICEEIEAELHRKLQATLYVRITPEDLRTYIKVLYQFAKLDEQEK